MKIILDEKENMRQYRDDQIKEIICYWKGIYEVEKKGKTKKDKMLVEGK